MGKVSTKHNKLGWTLSIYLKKKKKETDILLHNTAGQSHWILSLRKSTQVIIRGRSAVCEISLTAKVKRQNTEENNRIRSKRNQNTVVTF